MRFIARYLGALGVVLLSLASAVQAAEPLTYKLLGRSTVEGYQVDLEESDRQWLRGQGTLVLGASEPEYPPFGITSNGRDYEGITADYAQLLGELLGVEVKVRSYGSRADVIAALKAHQIDFLGTANGFEVVDPQVVLSSAYADDQPTLVSRIDAPRDVTPDLAGKRLAMVYYYLPPNRCRRSTPRRSCNCIPRP